MSCKIKDLCERIGSGGTPSRKNKSYYDLGNIKWLKTKELDDIKIYDTEEKITEEGLKKSSAKLYPKDTIVMAMYGATVGKLGIIKEEMCTNQACCNMVVDSNKCNYKFLYYSLLYNRESIINLANGAAQQNLSVGVIGDYEINLPSLEEQEKIADILSSLDDKVELNNEMNKTLEEMAQSIFKRWFVDFEFPNEDGEPYKSSGGEMVDSELGMIPKGWEVKSLDEIANFLNGLAMQKFRPLDTDEEFLQVVKIKELKQGSTSNDSDRCSINIDEKYIINDGDVIFAWSGSLDVRIWCGGKAGLNQHLFKVTSDDYPKWFYYLWVKNYLEQFIRIAADRATTMGHIKRSNLTEAKVLVPDESRLMVMGYTLENLVCKFIENNIESKSLVDLRDSLLPKLMSGEIRVK